MCLIVVNIRTFNYGCCLNDDVSQFLLIGSKQIDNLIVLSLECCFSFLCLHFAKDLKFTGRVGDGFVFYFVVTEVVHKLLYLRTKEEWQLRQSAIVTLQYIISIKQVSQIALFVYVQSLL